MSPHKRLTYLNLCAAGHGSLTFIALATALSYIFNDPAFVFSFFTGLYLAAWGMGTLWAEKYAGDHERIVRLILFNSLAGILLANPGIWAILGANEMIRYVLRARHQDLLFLRLPAGIILTLCLGMVFGARQSAFSKLMKSKNYPGAGAGSKFWESGYSGAFAGIMLFTFIFNPFGGLVRGLLLSQVITLGIIDLAFFRLSPASKPFVLKIMLLGTNIYVLASLLAQRFVINGLDALSGL
ncbi:MAG: hypothetical protein WC450_10420 [Candidatus Omnitrophota bacterium]|jgi:predicted membrane-bound spermidine synthase